MKTTYERSYDNKPYKSRKEMEKEERLAERERELKRQRIQMDRELQLINEQRI